MHYTIRMGRLSGLLAVLFMLPAPVLAQAISDEDAAEFLSVAEQALENEKALLEGRAPTLAAPQARSVDEIRPIESGSRMDRTTDFISRLVAYSQAKEVELTRRAEGIALDTVLKPETLMSEERSADALALLAQYETVLNDIDTFNTALREHAKTQLGAIWAGEPSGALVIAGFVHGMDQKRVLLDRHLKLQRGVVEIGREMHAFMAPRRARAALDDGQILFESDADVEGYNAIIGRLQTLVAQEQQSNEALRESVEQREQALQKLQQKTQPERP